MFEVNLLRDIKEFIHLIQQTIHSFRRIGYLSFSFILIKKIFEEFQNIRWVINFCNNDKII